VVVTIPSIKVVYTSAAKENDITNAAVKRIIPIVTCPSSYKTAQISAWAKRDFAHLVG
jgi:hypothetical protein